MGSVCRSKDGTTLPSAPGEALLMCCCMQPQRTAASLLLLAGGVVGLLHSHQAYILCLLLLWRAGTTWVRAHLPVCCLLWLCRLSDGTALLTSCCAAGFHGFGVHPS